MTFATETFLPTAVCDTMQIILPFGLIGLGELREFELQPIEDSWPFLYLRSRGALEIEFLAVEAQNAVSDYGIEIGEEETRELDLITPDEALVLTLVTVHSHRPQFVTVNLAGPILVNRRTLLGRQIVLTGAAKYSTVHPIIDERGQQPVALP